MFAQKRDIHKICFEYIRKPDIEIRLETSQMKYLHTFFGQRFIAGYRIFETMQPSIIVLTMMQYNTLIFSEKNDRNSQIKGQYPHFQIVCLRSQNDISQNRELRIKIYKQINEIYSYLQGTTEIYILYLNIDKLSKISPQELVSSSSPNVRKYYQQKKLKNNPKYRFKSCKSNEQGEKLHRLVEIYVKGATKFRNQSYAYNNINHYRFAYNPDYVLNTVSYLIGKEVIQNRFVALSSEKWMRKSIVKKFKRYDLILRNEHEVCIIDWKFSTRSAYEVVNAPQNRLTTRTYYQLARKQYKAGVKLKYFCIHRQIDQSTHNHHIYTHAQFEYKSDTIEIDKQIQLEILMQNSYNQTVQPNAQFLLDVENDNSLNDLEQLKQIDNNQEDRFWGEDDEDIREYEKQQRISKDQENKINDFEQAQKDFQIEDSSSNCQMSLQFKFQNNKKFIKPVQVIDLSYQKINNMPRKKRKEELIMSNMIILDSVSQSGI